MNEYSQRDHLYLWSKNNLNFGSIFLKELYKLDLGIIMNANLFTIHIMHKKK